MATIENFATVRYTSGTNVETSVSNVAQVSLISSVTLSKVPLGSVYGNDSLLTYILTIQNTSDTTLTGVTVSDDLGTFPYGGGSLTPLTFGGNAVLMINGQDATASLTVDASDPSVLTFALPPLSAGTTANIVYNALVNEFAPLNVGGTIANTATLTADAECADGSATATVRVEEGADLSVLKQMCPNPVVCGSTLTYTLRVSNYGNIDATDVQLTDVFDPVPDLISIERNGVPLTATEYTYENGTLIISAGSATGDTVPAATFARDPQTGAVTVNPGVVEYVITGTI